MGALIDRDPHAVEDLAWPAGTSDERAPLGKA
jgi:hypothetical protein